MVKFVKQQIWKTSIQGTIAFAMEFLEIGNKYLQKKRVILNIEFVILKNPKHVENWNILKFIHIENINLFFEIQMTGYFNMECFRNVTCSFLIITIFFLPSKS
jgi:hypothetical protein